MSEVSNVRRRKRISSQAEDFDPQEELLQAASEGRRPGLFPKAQDAEPEAFTSNERIWVNFGIKPNLPTRTKIEQLLILYRLPLDEIANILELDTEAVEDIVSTLNSEWAALGKVMTPEERDVARGRMIADLLRLKSEIEDAMIGATPTDKARMLTLKMNVVNQLTQLQGLSLDKKDVPRPEDEIVDPIEEKVNALSEERQKELHDRLRTVQI
jgi:hypothetical protein